MKLIINADDYGFTKGTNKAIFELAHLKTLSSTSVMVNMPYASEICALNDLECFGIGLHFNLTQGKPILAKDKVHSLVDEKGEFYDINIFRRRVKLKLIRPEHIINELNAQYSCLLQLIGNRISHIDSHQDINKYALVNEALLCFVREKQIKVSLRWYNKFYLLNQDISYSLIEPSIFNFVQFGLNRVIKEIYFRNRRLRFNEFFSISTGMLYTKDHSTRNLLRIIPKVLPKIKSQGIYEVMCHPASDMIGLSDAEKPEIRIEEFEILRSVEFQNFVIQNKLLNFSHIR
jgi:predicted glycoside hydrolase/deacetylase ChbG (UPF0249 family)